MRSTLETKVHNVFNTGVFPASQSISSATAGYIFSLNQVAAGTGDDQRVGDKISGFLTTIKWTLEATATGDTANAYVRIVIFAAEKGEFASSSDTFLLDGDNVPKALTASQLADINSPINKKDISVYKDKIYVLGQDASTSSANPFKRGAMKIKLNQIVQFESSTTGDARKNNLRMLIFIRSIREAGTSSGLLNFQSRYYYKDV